MAQQVNAKEDEIKSLQQKLKAEKDKNNQHVEKLKNKDIEIDRIKKTQMNNNSISEDLKIKENEINKISSEKEDLSKQLQNKINELNKIKTD